MQTLTHRLAFLTAFLGLLLLSLWWINAARNELAASGVLLSVWNLKTAQEIIQQINFENETTTESSGGGNRGQRPGLKEEIEAAKSRLPRSEYRAAKSKYRQMMEHIDKLQKYRENPWKYDNKELLKKASSDEMRQKIIESRIRLLEGQIELFYREVIKIIK